MTASAPLLSVHNLSITLPTGADREMAVKNVSFTVNENEIVCLVGESGSGKSMIAHSILGLLPKRVHISGGDILFGNAELTKLSPDAMRRLRGRDIAMIFQEPLSALNPLQRVGAQVAEALEVHQTSEAGTKPLRQHVEELLDAVGLPEPATLMQSYPFQLSGGQRQRVMIAGALANNPQLLLADEPTTALDVTTQRQILDLILGLRQKRGMGVLFITHDFGVVADIADRVLVMRHGEVVEEGKAADILRNPQHEYTKGLLAALPGQSEAKGVRKSAAPLLEISRLSKTFATRQGLFARSRRVEAARDISFQIAAGETVAVVGESGSGKSTLGQMVMQILPPDSGQIRFEGTDTLALRGNALREFRRNVQIIFQDPFGSLNPRQKVGDAIQRGPMAFGMPRHEAQQLAKTLLKRVGLGPEASNRYPHEFSGGQRQRISIARALALKPKLLVADEPVSALDVSIQAQILELLAELKREFGLAMLFITHDLRVAADIADVIIVMHRGRIVEMNDARELLANPQNAYTCELLNAVPGRQRAVRD